MIKKAFGEILSFVERFTKRAIVSWETHLARIGIYAGIGMAFLLLLRLLVDHLLLPGVRIRDEIVEDRNTNAAWVEGVVLTGMAGLLITVL